jgi:hypothetical protein
VYGIPHGSNHTSTDSEEVFAMLSMTSNIAPPPNDQGHRAGAVDVPLKNRLVRPLRCTALFVPISIPGPDIALGWFSRILDTIVATRFVIANHPFVSLEKPIMRVFARYVTL